MSLVDALPLDPCRDPREVLIALRGHGQRGSGTMDDPFDNSRKNFIAIAISSRSKGGARNRVATVVAEGNRVFNTSFGGSYHDTFGTRDQTDRNNYHSDVLCGPYQNMGRSSDLKLGSLNLAGTTATFTTATPHGLVVGQAVRINPFLGTPPQEFFAVIALPSATSFEFQVSGTVTPAPSYSFGALWQVGLAIRENNTVELGEAHHPTTYGYSSGLPFYSTPHDGQYVFRSVIARDNLIRLVFGSTNSLAQGIQLENVERAVVEYNLIDLLSQQSMSISNSKPLHFFNNQSSSATLIRPTGGTTEDDLRTRIEDVLTLAL